MAEDSMEEVKKTVDILAVDLSIDDPDLIDCSEKKNRGCLKKILREGSGDGSPFEGATVYVHYVGRLMDGTIFDSSRQRNEPFSFELGKRKVIKGWDEGVATMKKGELVELVCTPDYAYGKSGSPPNIPPNSTLVFQVELLSWEDEDVSKEKDKSLLRRVIKNGSGYNHPNDDAKCKIRLIGFSEGQKFEEREVDFTVGESEEADLISGIDLALRKMKKGERSLFTFHPDIAFGKEGNAAKGIAPNQQVQYEITLVDFEKGLESWSMSAEQKLEAAEKAKTKGTAYFTVGNLKGAIKQYDRMKSFLSSDPEFKDNLEQKRKSLLTAGHLNLAMTYLKANDFVAARNAATEALGLDNLSVKGYYRRGMAHFHLKDYDEAKADFNKVIELEQENKEAKRQLALIAKEMKAQTEKERQTFRGMFDKFAAVDSKKQPQATDAGDAKSKNNTPA